MSQRRMFRRRADEQRPVSAADVLWGIPLREGHSEDDDPSAHRDVPQHAFLIGHDERAVCGFEPPRRSGPGGTARPALGLASNAYNPRCPRCRALVVRDPTE